MNNLNEEIKKRTDIVAFISSYMTLKKAGRNFKGNCPFHHEKTPSFVVSPERQIWHCFGSCGEGGDVIKFLMKWDNLTYVEAIKEFAHNLGLNMQDYAVHDAYLDQKERLYEVNKTAAQFYSYILHTSPFGEAAKAYLFERGLHEGIIKKFELGYAPSSWDSLLRFMESRKYTITELLEAGLVLKSERGSYYDRFRGRLMFPLKDIRDRTVGFSGRVLQKDEKSAKYVNTPETLIYHKREMLYGIHLAKEAIKKEKCAIIVEGEFDMITPYQNNIENIVAIKGSALTHEQLSLLKRYSNRIYLALDADDAGAQAIKRGIEEAEKYEFELGIIRFDFAKDPDEAVRKDIIAFKKEVSSPVPVYDYIIDVYRSKYPGNDAFSKKNIADNVTPFLRYIQNPIVRSHYVKKLSVLLDVDEHSVFTLLQIKSKKSASSSATFKKKLELKSNREETIENFFLGSLLQYDGITTLIPQIQKIITLEDFVLPSHQKLIDYIFKNQNVVSKDINTFVSLLPSELRAVCDELYLLLSGEEPMKEADIIHLAYEIKKYALKRKMKSLSSKELSSEDEHELSQYNLALKELEKKATTI